MVAEWRTEREASMDDRTEDALRDKLAVVVRADADGGAAVRLAEHLGVSLLDEGDDPSAYPLRLELGGDGLTLTDGSMALCADLRDMLPRLKPANLSRELLVRAAKVKGVDAPTAVDATAGLGADALLLAAAGFTVTLFERDRVIAALLADALRRAEDDSDLAGIVCRMRLVEGDSVEGLRRMAQAGENPDVVYLDPMFPERTKSAAVKKKFQLLHHLERPCADPELLLEAARAARPRKVVIKRPVKGPQLAGVKPSHTIAGKAVRYDCIVLPR